MRSPDGCGVAFGRTVGAGVGFGFGVGLTVTEGRGVAVGAGLPKRPAGMVMQIIKKDTASKSHKIQRGEEPP